MEGWNLIWGPIFQNFEKKTISNEPPGQVHERPLQGNIGASPVAGTLVGRGAGSVGLVLARWLAAV